MLKLKLLKHLILWVHARLESIAGSFDIYVPRMNIRVGGPKTFMAHFVATAKRQGLRVTHNRLSKAKSVLVPISMPESILKSWKRRNRGYVVQRLDGLFYDPETSSYDSGKNHDAKVVYDTYADAIIFQSEYSRKQCLHFWNEPRVEVKTALIENGTDLKTFQSRMADSWTPGKKVRFISTGNFRDPEMLIPILEALAADEL